MAAVAAESEAIAEKALSLIKVEYEILPGVFTAEEAMKQEAPMIHDEQLGGTSAWEQWGVAQKSLGNGNQGQQFERPYLCQFWRCGKRVS